MDTKRQPTLSRLMTNPLLRLLIAGFLGLIVAILLMLLMKYLITGPGDSGEGVFSKLFTLKTVILQDASKQRPRPPRPQYIEQPAQAPVFSDAEIKQQALEFLSSQSIEELQEPQEPLQEQPQPSTMEEMRKKREEMISILEQE